MTKKYKDAFEKIFTDGRHTEQTKRELELYLDDDDNIVYNSKCESCMRCCKQSANVEVYSCKRRIKCKPPREYIELIGEPEQVKEVLMELGIIPKKHYTSQLLLFIKACNNKAEFKTEWHEKLMKYFK